MNKKIETSGATVSAVAGFVAYTIGSVILTATVVQGMDSAAGLVFGGLVTVLGLAFILVAVARVLDLHERQAHDVHRAAADLARIARYLKASSQTDVDDAVRGRPQV